MTRRLNSKLLRRLGMICAAATAVVLLSTLSTSKAQDPPAENQGAIVIRDGDLCTMVGADSDGNLVYEVNAGETILSLANNNKVMLHCVGSGLMNESGRAQVFTDIPCFIDFPELPGSPFFALGRAVVSRSGRGSLHCTVDLPYEAP